MTNHKDEQAEENVASFRNPCFYSEKIVGNKNCTNTITMAILMKKKEGESERCFSSDIDFVFRRCSLCFFLDIYRAHTE